MLTRIFFFFITCFNLQAYTSNTIIPTPGLNGVFFESFALAITPNGRNAYVTNLHNGSVSVIDIATNTLIDTIFGFPSPQSVAITPDSRYAFVAAAGIGSVVVIDTTSNTIVATISGLGYTSSIAITSNGKYAYVTNDASVTVIDTSTFAIKPTPALQNAFPTGPDFIAISPKGKHAYVATLFDGTVHVIDIKTNTLLDTPGLNGQFSDIQSLTVTPNGKYVYVTSGLTHTVNVIEIATNTVLSTPNLTSAFDFPVSVGITPDSRSAYVVNAGGNSVSLIDIATNTIVPTPGLSSGFSNPQAIAITPSGLFGYITDADNNSVTVIFIGLNSPPNFHGCKGQNIFLPQTEYFIRLTWSKPTGNQPVAYRIYRDAALNQLVATVPASGLLQYCDQNINPCLNYTYYIISVDAEGNTSSPPSVTTVTQYC